MNIKELRSIFIKEEIPDGAYDIVDKGWVTASDGVILRENEGVYEMVYSERGVEEVLQESDNENTICIAFIKEMARGYKRLRKYL